MDSLEPIFANTDLGEIVRLNVTSTDGRSLAFIPYYLWGNRGESQMTVWVNE
jgi:DUF1680 family protein